MKKAPTLWRMEDLMKSISQNTALIDGKLYPARPIGYFSIIHRIHLSWLVFTGKADALLWMGGQ